MKRAIFILGAGASKGLGLPLLAQVFGDLEVQSYLANDARNFAAFLTDVIWTPRGLSIHRAADTLNIEEILTLLRTWEHSGSSLLRHEEILALQIEVLGCVYHGVWPQKGKTSTDKRYLNALVKWANESFDEVTWATFNWDAKLEQAFYHQIVKYPKFISRYPKLRIDQTGWLGENPRHTLLKLHGSVTWINSSSGTKVLPLGPEVEGYWLRYLHGRSADEPVIAEPSSFKHEVLSRPEFREQWECFSEALAVAGDIFVLGYSLPDGDIMAKQAFITSVACNPSARWCVVDPGARTRENYRRLIGCSRVFFPDPGLVESWVSTL